MLPTTDTASSKSQHRLWLAPTFTAVAAVGTTVAVALIDPNEPGHYPTCPSLAIAGVYCPGCGSLRTLRALAHLDFGSAVAMNVLLVAAIPLLVWAWVSWTATALGQRVWFPHLRASHIWMLLGLFVTYAVIRNLPWQPFMWFAPGS